MSEKVKLTREQAEAIEKLKKMAVSDDVIIHNTVFYQVTERERDTAYKPFKGIDLDTLIRALYIGYEVEPSIKIGDFVDIGLFGISKIAEVTGVKGNTIAINGSEEYHEFKINRVLTDEEKQEEKQRRWWAKHGREVWELRDGDLLRSTDTKKTYELNNQTSYGAWFEGLTSGIAHRVVKRNYKVICFAEDRKDIDGGDNE